jgi:hypothetical protein
MTKKSKAKKEDLLQHIVEQIKEGEKVVAQIEKYGLREIKTDRITGEISGEDSPLVKASILNTHALELLKAKRYSSKLEAPKEGGLNPKATAWELLQAQRDLFSTFMSKNPEDPYSGIDLFQEQVFRLCNAWHWMHMECFDEHAKAVKGQRAEQTQEKVGKTISSKAQTRRQIIDDELNLLSGRKGPSSAPEMAKKIADRVAQRFKSANLGSYSPRKLIEVIRERQKRT